MEPFTSPEMMLRLYYAEQRHVARQDALIALIREADSPRTSFRHTLAEAFRQLAVRIDSPAMVTDPGRVVAQI